MSLLESLVCNVSVHFIGHIVIVVMTTYNIKMLLTGLLYSKGNRLQDYLSQEPLRKSQCLKIVSGSFRSAPRWRSNAPSAELPRGWVCTWVQPPSLLKCLHPRGQTVNTCLGETQVFNLEKNVIPGNHLVPDTCLYRCVACVNYSEFFLKSSHDRKLSRKEDKNHLFSSYPYTVYVHVSLCSFKVKSMVLILFLSFHLSTEAFFL